MSPSEVFALNYYPHHIGDFIRDTARLSDTLCMAYLRMIWLYYETESPLPYDCNATAFKIGANALDVQSLLNAFFIVGDDGLWHNSRCDRVISDYYSKAEKAKKSANARWNNAKKMRTHTERNADESKIDASTDAMIDANQEPITNNHKKKDQKILSPQSDDAADIALPSCIPTDAWSRWIIYRRSRKLSVSKTAISGHIKLLTELSQQGQDTSLVIQQSIDQGWQGLFPVKSKTKTESRDEARARTIQALTGQSPQGGDNGRVIDITPAATAKR